MSQKQNPFVRGYRNLRIERTLVVATENDHSLTNVPLHESQRDLPSQAVRSKHCIFNGDFALVVTEQKVPRQLMMLCEERGLVRDVVYSVVSDEDGVIHHIGDLPALNLADEVVARLTFQTGQFSRCWEISDRHITEEAAALLAELADIATPTSFLFVAFRIPYSPAIGVKLISTPWTDDNLRQLNGITANQLRKAHLNQGMPEHLAEILHLAANADTRILIFDGDSPVLDGLPVFEE